jgi:hypothetical protein
MDSISAQKVVLKGRVTTLQQKVQKAVSQVDVEVCFTEHNILQDKCDLLAELFVDKCGKEKYNEVYAGVFVQIEVSLDNVPSQLKLFNFNHRSENCNVQNRKCPPTTCLPELQTQCLSGNVEEWLTLQDMFTVVVYSKPHLSDAQKPSHMKTMIQEEPEQLI